MLVELNDEEALEALMERVRHWTDDRVECALFEDMYKNYIYGGVFEQSEFNVDVIVDNDYINWCSFIYKDDDDFPGILKVFKDQGLGDCSCEDCRGSFIEAVDDDDEPELFLIREC